jgi:hypothetical protein
MSDFDTSLASPGRLITRAQSEPTGKRVEPFLVRRPYYYVDPGAYAAAAWRQVVARAPIVRSCIATLILQLTAVPYDIQCEDEKRQAYYLSVLDHLNGEDWRTFWGRVIRDTLEVPFGGAFEPVRWQTGPQKGELYTLLHVDGGSLAPTYDRELPYVQINPLRSYDRVHFGQDELIRLPWMMRTDLQSYGWSFTPCMDCFPAIESLVRSDIFYNSLLSDTPPPGILDLLDMTYDDASTWVESFRATFEGIDRFKVPVLYDHSQKAEWISFQETGLHSSLAEIVKRYAEIVASAFGMSIVDLGLYEYAQTKAGGVAQLDASRRQGLGALMNAIATVLNARVFPDDVKFVWKPVDTEDSVKKASAQKTRIDGLKTLVEAKIIKRHEARDMLAAEGIIVPDPKVKIEDEDEEAPPPERPNGPPQKGEVVGEEEEVPSESGKPVADEERPTEKALYSLILDEGYRVRHPWEDCERTVDWDLLVARAESGEDPLPVPRTDPAYLSLVEALSGEFARMAARLPRSLVERAVDRVWDALAEPVKHAASADAIVAGIRAVLAESDALELSDEGLGKVMAALSLAYEQGLLEAAESIWDALKSNGHVEGALGLKLRLRNPETLELLRQNVVTLGRDLDEGTASIVARLVYAGVRDGRAVYGKDSIVDEIVKAFPLAIGRRRAQSIGLFEVNKVESLGHLKQYRTFGLTKKAWDTIEALACDLCQRNAARGFVPMEAKFQNVFGECDGPPGHPTICHCRVRFDRQELLERARSGQLFTLFDGESEVEYQPEPEEQHLTGEHFQKAHGNWASKRPGSTRPITPAKTGIGKESVGVIGGKTIKKGPAVSEEELERRRKAVAKKRGEEADRKKADGEGKRKDATPLPSVTPVGDALFTKARGHTANVLKRAVDAIAQVHGDGVLPKIEVKQSASRGHWGTFRSTWQGQPVDITVSKFSGRKHNTTLHEIGHFLDLAGLGKGSGSLGRNAYASGSHPDLAEWRDAVKKSRAIKSLTALSGVSQVNYKRADGSEAAHSVDRKYVGYLLKWNEVFARSYAQYIAVRAKDPVLRAELDAERAGHGQTYHYHQAWDDDDFEPIAQSFDRLFAKRGWRK